MAGKWDEFKRFEETMSKLYEDFWGRPMRHRFAPSGRLLPPEKENGQSFENKQPFIDVIETEKQIIITAAMPGLEKEDININISSDRVEISTENRGEIKENNHLYEKMSNGGYCSVISLRSLIDSDKSKAIYNNGVLEVTMPKIKVEKKVLKAK